MRPLTLETTTTITQASPPPAATTAAGPPCDTQVHDCRWWPYSNSNDFGANTAMIVIILLCVLICALSLNAALRCFLKTSTTRRGRRPSEPTQERKPSSETPAPLVVASSKMVYSSGMKLGDCAICLSEFVEGEGVRVLDRCKHGFHGRCIDTWLSGHSSCPTCRASCFAVPLPPPPAASELESGGVVVERADDRESGGGPADVIN